MTQSEMNGAEAAGGDLERVIQANVSLRRQQAADLGRGVEGAINPNFYFRANNNRG